MSTGLVEPLGEAGSFQGQGLTPLLGFFSCPEPPNFRPPLNASHPFTSPLFPVSVRLL